MSIPAGHLLSHSIRACGAYTARCGCGLDVWGLTLPLLWEHHSDHLRAVKAASMRQHPSRRKP